MKHPNLLWNPETHEWFCTRCFRTSDHMTGQDATKGMLLVRGRFYVKLQSKKHAAAAMQRFSRAVKGQLRDTKNG
jgi:5-methylcytosine-specific restriction endonuclease McrA